MPKNKNWKSKVRARSEKTGESYTSARAHLLGHGEGGPRGPIVVLHGPPRFEKLGFRVDGNWGSDCIRRPETREPVFEALCARVASEQPEILDRVRASVGLAGRIPNVITDYHLVDVRDEDFWFGLNLLALEDAKVAGFLAALQHVGWAPSIEESEEMWSFFRDTSPSASEFLPFMMKTWAESRFFGDTKEPPAVAAAIAAALHLDEHACRARLAQADAALACEGWAPNVELPSEYREAGLLRRGERLTVEFRDRQLQLKIGETYLASTASFADGSTRRPCILLAVNHPMTPSTAWVRWRDTKRLAEVEVHRLWPGLADTK